MAIDQENVTPQELPPIVEEAIWEDHLPAVVTGVIIRGGDDGKGAANFQARTLDKRTRWLKDMVEKLATNGIILRGYLADEDALAQIPTDDLQVGTAFFVDFAMRVWNGTEWATSGSLRGERGLNLLGVWPEEVSLPEPEENAVGDAYIWNHDFWVLVPNPTRWEAMGIRGPEGASAYEVWESKPANKGKTEAQYLASLIGKDSYQIAVDQGFVGDRNAWLDSLRARSNYEIWLDQGNEGTEYDYLQTLKSTVEGPRGIQGVPGKDGRNLVIKGTVTSQANLPSNPVDQDAWVTADTNHLWMYIVNVWTDLGPFRGANGTNGTNGRNVTVLGAVAQTSNLPNNPSNQDCYSVTSENALYMWISTQWVNLGTFKGTDGKIGKDGTNGTNGTNGLNIVLTGAVDTFSALPTSPVEQDVYSVRDTNTLYGRINNQWVNLGKFQGEKGADSTVAGPKGENGKNVILKGAVNTFADLPTTNRVEQDAYSVRDTNTIHMWISGAWVNLGTFRGTDGVDGTDGTSVIVKGSVATFANLPPSPTEQDVYSVIDENALYAWISNAWILLGKFKGADGKDGTNGTNGTNGKSADIIKILTPEDSTPPPANASTAGKAYLDLNKIVWINVSGSAWEEAGPFNGQPGEIGPAGAPLKPRGTVPTVTQLPALSTTEEGDLWFTADTKLGYAVVDGQWSEPFNIIGPQGEQGLEGLPGAMMPILGLYNSMSELTTDHPTGAKGDAYLIVTGTESRDLVVWNTNTSAWQNTGPAGIVGPRGPKGADSTVPGPKGDKGSQWLILPEGQDEPSETFNGRAGDWAVTKNLRVWYKTADRGWIFWNWLVAGDVNSPLLSLGKVVRLGSEWVAVPVDEVVDPEAGKVYGRKLKSGSEDETEWVEITFPDVTNKDGKQYVRVWLTNGDTPVWQEVVFPAGMPDVTTKDGKQYCRTWAVGSETPIWKEIVFPAGIADLVTKDDKQYIRIYRTGQGAPEWREIVFPESVTDQANPEANAVYLRQASSKTWVKFVTPPTTPATTMWVSQAGNWISFDRYDLIIKAISATYTIDPTKEQFVKLDNSGSTAKQISLSNGPGSTRAMVVILEVVGIVGAVTYGGTNIKWADNTIPTLTGTKNLITFTWDGEVWIGAKGPGLLT